MNGITKATLALAAFVVVLGAVLWVTTDRPYFAAFIVLGLVTGAGAWFTRPAAPSAGRTTPEEKK
ncbi:hypothetical protein [Modestobacter sp. NPDC049651]|uniref:hypothetical protein n=1 Tax=unclassified Modestobacter TaxID=2643866 RepID=UPI00340FADFB